ncbi:MAG: SURF1 family protein [Hyphomicrobiaceae bacterium]
MAVADRKLGLLWPSIFSAFALVALIGLGTWQLQRLHWKNGLIAQIEARTHATPVPFADALASVRRGDDLEYTRVAVSGRWVPGVERYLWAPLSSGPGWHVYAPLKTAAGPIVMINRGFVPDARRDPASRPEPDSSGEVSLVGLLRKPEVKTPFTPDNDLARNMWYSRDVDGMAQSLSPGLARQVVPFAIDAEAGSAPPPAPQGGVTRLELPNSHLQYAVTWYGLAATLVGVYVAFVWSRLHRDREAAKSATQGSP